MNRDHFDSESRVQRAIDEFERCAISRERWSYDFRLVVTMWYLLTYDEAAATARLVSGMRAMARSHERPREPIRLQRNGYIVLDGDRPAFSVGV